MRNGLLVFISIIISLVIAYNLNSSTMQDKDKKNEIVFTKERQSLKKIEKIEKSEFLVENSTTDYPDDIYKRFVFLFKNKEYDKALEIYKNEYASSDYNLYFNFLHNEVESLVKNEPKKAAKLADKILEISPDDTLFLYFSMNADIKLKHYNQAYEKVLKLKQSYIPTYLGKKIDYDYRKLTLLRKEEKEKDRLSKLFDIKIQMEKVGKHYLIPFEINKEVKVKLMIDTGASGVSIKTSILENLNLKVYKYDQIYNTANGQVKRNIYHADVVKVGPIELFDFKIAEMDNYLSTYNEGLLGMSFLEKFDWQIEEESSTLLLKSKN